MRNFDEKINLEILPEEAKKELAKFYRSLLKKYKLTQIKKKPDDIDEFFDKFNLELSSFKFNRTEANER